MSHLNRVWVAATVAVAQGHTDPSNKWKSGFKSIQQNRRRLFSVGESSDLRPLAGMMGSDIAGVVGNRDDDGRRRQSDDSLRKVMVTIGGQMEGVDLVDRVGEDEPGTGLNSKLI
ncbi:hypothetical protein L6164_018767 [Bauhinia variegata]|uniref:Uncharacterized protein n=1 Tax=Bauhinia variegata TaxID=167791 RepID=A0ACB9NCY9_BAUVA|nr:hypothetical protein L6164_018767 [Bauhinia variegata]